jgi:hypothetical protein
MKVEICVAGPPPSALATRMITSLEVSPPRIRFEDVHAWFRQVWGKYFWEAFNRTIPMIKSLVVAAALSIGLAGYAFAQNTITGAPAGTAPETPAPGTPLPIPGVTPTPTGSHSSHVRRRANASRERARASAHHMHHMRHNPAPKPAT